MGKKNIAIVFFLLLLVSCSTKHYFVIYGGKNRPTQLMFGGEWIEKDSIEQFVYRDTAQIMKLNRYFDVYPSSIVYLNKKINIYEFIS